MNRLERMNGICLILFRETYMFFAASGIIFKTSDTDFYYTDDPKTANNNFFFLTLSNQFFNSFPSPAETRRALQMD